MTLACATGWPASLAFSRVSDWKYAVTVVVPLLLTLLLLSARPAWVATAAAVVVAPFAGFGLTAAGVELTVLLLVTLLLLVTTVALSDDRVGPSATGPAAAVAGALLLPSLLRGSGQGEQLLLVAGMVTLAVAAAQTASSAPAGARLVVGAVLVSGLIQSVLAVREFTSGTRWDFYGSSGAAQAEDFFEYGDVLRAQAAFPDPISLAHFLAVVVPLAFAATVLAVHTRRWQEAALAGATFLAACAALLLTLSRSAWIGCAVGLLVTALFLPRRLRVPAVLSLSASALGMLAWAAATAGPALQARFASIFAPTRASSITWQGDRLRLDIWNSATDAFATAPWFGIGRGHLTEHLRQDLGPSIRPGSHAHNLYLQYAAEAGLLGLLALACLAVGLGVDLRRALRVNPLAGALVGGFAAVAVASMTDYTLQYPALALSLAPCVGLAVAWGRGARVVDLRPLTVAASRREVGIA